MSYYLGVETLILRDIYEQCFSGLILNLYCGPLPFDLLSGDCLLLDLSGLWLSYPDWWFPYSIYNRTVFIKILKLGFIVRGFLSQLIVILYIEVWDGISSHSEFLEILFRSFWLSESPLKSEVLLNFSVFICDFIFFIQLWMFILCHVNLMLFIVMCSGQLFSLHIWCSVCFL